MLNKKKLIQLNKTGDKFITSLYGKVVSYNKKFGIMFNTKMPDCTIKISDFKPIMNILKSEEGMQYSLSEGVLTISKGSHSFQIDTVDGSHRWRVPFDFEGEKLGTVTKDELKSYAKFTSDDDIRENLHYIKLGERGMFATDAHHLKFDYSRKFHKEVLVHQDIPKVLLEDEYSVRKAEGGVYLISEDQKIFIVGQSGVRFPNVETVIPDPYRNELTVEREGLYEALKTCKKLKKDTKEFMILTDKMKYKYDNYSYDIESIIKIDTENESISSDFVFYYEKLFEIVKDIDWDTVTINFDANKSRQVIINGEYVILPL